MKKWIMMAALVSCLFTGMSTVQAQEVTPDEVGLLQSRRRISWKSMKII